MSTVTTMEKPRAVAVIPFADQRPGTSGLRKTVAVFRQPGYIEAYVQATLDTMPKVRGATVVLGGDGRYYNDQALATLLRLLAANGVARAYVGAGGLLSTPAASLAIRKKHADFGFVLSASHNPGGPEGDFGLKLNLANGGPAPEGVTEAIFAKSKTITRFLTIAAEAPDLARPGRFDLAGMTVEVFDPVADYADLMERLFDFDRIRRLITSGLRLRFDAMHAITGPYAIEILERRLGASPGSVVNGAPLADFGGHHPDPNPAHAADLIAWAAAQEGAVFAAASDGDGDRHMIVGRDGPIAPSDSLAILAANAHLVPAFRDGLRGVARSMPTAPALDRVAAALGLPCFETPTGWKFFGTLLDAGKIRLCGEESAGASGDHVREKDGLWAALFWLDILAARGMTVDALRTDHWRHFGRYFTARHDYEGLDKATADRLIADLRASLPTLPGRRFGVLTVGAADEFAYTDPVDGAVSARQGIRVFFREGARAVYRLSGTGTSGATMRVYLDRHEPDPARQDRPAAEALAEVAFAAGAVARLAETTGRKAPTNVQ